MTSATARQTYLDYNATAPMLPEAAAAVRACLTEFGNPSSIHAAGRRARALVEDARDAVAATVGVAAHHIVFTAGATEANAMALRGYGVPAAQMFCSAIEHPSVLGHIPADNRLPVTTAGTIDVGAAANVIHRTKGPIVVAVMLVNNETGVIQPVQELATIVHAHGGFVHCDAVQALGRVPIDFAAIGVDTLALSGHKIGGPKGAGALVVGSGAELAALITGGGQERGRRAGTENVMGLVGFGAAAKAVPRQLADQARIRGLRDGLEKWIAAAVPSAVIHGATAARVANTACVSAPGHTSEMQVITLDLAGVAVSAGAACSSGRVAESHVLAGMGLPSDLVRSAIRISLGPETTAADIDAFRAAWAPARAERAA